MRIPRNAPPLFNLHEMDVMFWDGRVTENADGSFDTPAGAQLTPAMQATLTLGAPAAQAMFPVTSREEMRGEVGDNELADLDDDDFTGIWAGLMDRLGAIPVYRDLFEDAYPGEHFCDMTFAHAANAIAAYEIASFESTGSPFDDFVAGDDRALSLLELAGGVQFYRTGCGECHAGPLLSDLSHANTGVPQLGPGKGDGATGTDDFGRERVTGDAADRYAFRVPPLGNVGLTGPYGHVGQADSLLAWVSHYPLPRLALVTYDETRHVDDPVLWGTVEDDALEVAAGIDADVDALGRVRPRRIVRFLDALTDPAMEDLDDTIPRVVPSGLPVED